MVTNPHPLNPSLATADIARETDPVLHSENTSVTAAQYTNEGEKVIASSSSSNSHWLEAMRQAILERSSEGVGATGAGTATKTESMTSMDQATEGLKFTAIRCIETTSGEVFLIVSDNTKDRAEMLGRLCTASLERTLFLFFPECVIGPDGKEDQGLDATDVEQTT